MTTKLTFAQRCETNARKMVATLYKPGKGRPLVASFNFARDRVNLEQTFQNIFDFPPSYRASVLSKSKLGDGRWVDCGPRVRIKLSTSDVVFQVAHAIGETDNHIYWISAESIVDWFNGGEFPHLRYTALVTLPASLRDDDSKKLPPLRALKSDKAVMETNVYFSQDSGLVRIGTTVEDAS